MAEQVTLNVLNRNEMKVLSEGVSITGDGVLIDYNHQDSKVLLVFDATDEVTVTVHGGNGVQGTDEATKEFSLTAGQTGSLVLESGFYEDVKVNKGMVKITATGTVKVRAIALP